MGTNRSQDALVSNELDSVLFLDYIPLLRVMAEHEKAADAVFQEVMKLPTLVTLRPE